MGPAESAVVAKRLSIQFHGRIIDHLGIQMYQSPVAALAELIANAWDADSNAVRIHLPAALGGAAVIKLEDDGDGMTFEECQRRYLNVGAGRRAKDPTAASRAGRPVLGRKGIGKFAGFGIAQRIRVDTTSRDNGERTVFELDIDQLRGEEYVDTKGDVKVIEYNTPDEARRQRHGTVVTLSGLKLSRNIAPDQFRRSMARRFLLAQRADNFQITVNGEAIPTEGDEKNAEFVFPRDYKPDELPAGLTVEKSGWGTEAVAEGGPIRWRIVFYEDPIPDRELQGVSIMCRGKIAQEPFYFNLAGGLGGQHAQEYVSGTVEADYLDSLETDVISTERQRINWQDPAAAPLQEWGQSRLQELYLIWKDRRAEERIKEVEQKISAFLPRLEKLPKSERTTIKRALARMAGIPKLSRDSLHSIANAMLTAWEGGRLKELVTQLAEAEDMDAVDLVSILAEANVLTALHTAEAVRAKLEIIGGLVLRFRANELENSLRDYIASSPWLLGPQWEYFKDETRVTKLLKEARNEVGMDKDDDWKGRLDLALSAGERLLVVEFMRPGLTADQDHLQRLQAYVAEVRSQVEGLTALGIRHVEGLLVADRLGKKPRVGKLIQSMRDDEITAIDWDRLLSTATAQWRDYLHILLHRAPDDERLKALAEEIAKAQV